MKHLKKFGEKILEGRYVDGFDFEVEKIREINNLYGILAEYLREMVLEECDIFSDSWYFMNGYFGTQHRIKDVNFFNDNILEREKNKEFVNNELFMIKAITIDGLSKDSIINLVKHKDNFESVISAMKSEDKHDVLNDEVLVEASSPLDSHEVGKLPRYFECYWYNNEVIFLKQLRDGTEYNIRIKLSLKN